MQASVRAAAVSLLTDYAGTANVRLQVYPARPASIAPPTAFVDRLSEQITYVGSSLMQRTPRAHVIVLHGLFDSKDSADQKDAFVDGFITWVSTRFHEAGENSLIGVVGTEDIPGFVPEWMAPEKQRRYYATEIVLEGYAES